MTTQEQSELHATYLMLSIALPLARIALSRGGVKLLDQQTFWDTFRMLQEFVPPDVDDLYSADGIQQRINDLWQAPPV